MSEVICEKCGAPKGQQSGSLTQWVKLCHCDHDIVSRTERFKFCKRCGKRIAMKKPGSMTQFIFRYEVCECETPLDSEIFDQGSTSERVSDRALKIDSDQVLQLDEKEFPLERFIPIEELGRGMSGRVYYCQDKILQKPVAVKTLIELNQAQLVLFQQEAKSTAKLDHPNITKILDFGIAAETTPYMVFDYFNGVSFDKILKEHGPVDSQQAREIFAQVTNALEYSHQQNIFHKDIKPSNILINDDDDKLTVKLIDFGLAQVKESTELTTVYQQRTLVGTPLYMSPDTARGETYDQCSEIYSLGCVLFEALTGQPPYNGDTALKILNAHANNPAPKLNNYIDSSEEDLEAIIAKCLAKEKEKRFQSMASLRGSLNIESDQSTPEIYDSSEEEPKEDAMLVGQKYSTTGGRYSLYISLFLVFILAVPVMLLLQQYFNDTPDSSIIKVKTDDAFDLDSQLGAIKKTGLVTLVPKPFTGTDPKEYDAHEYKVIGVLNGQKSILENAIKKTPVKITSLVIEYNNVRGKALEPLSALSLRGLRLDECELNKETMTTISKLSSLQGLRIENSRVEDVDFHKVSLLPKLTYFRLVKIDLTKERIESISKCGGLTTLSLRDCKIKSAPSIVQFRHLENLSNLEFRQRSIEKLNFVFLKNLKKLNRLATFELPDNLVKNLSQTKLKLLTLQDNSKITDKQLVPIVMQIKSLTTLKIINCPRINKNKVKRQLKRVNMNLRVI